jgi:hypothetical protein
MEAAIQVLLLIVLVPMALGILLFILSSIRDSYWDERNRKYRMEQRSAANDR